jgi:thioredoxin 1
VTVKDRLSSAIGGAGGKDPAMAADNVQEFTDDNFESDVLQSDKPVLVDFWAEWCAPCRMLSPVIDEVASDFNGMAVVGKMDTDANRGVPVKYGISAIPTVILFHKGEVVKKFIGLTSKDDLASAITEAAG